MPCFYVSVPTAAVAELRDVGSLQVRRQSFLRLMHHSTISIDWLRLDAWVVLSLVVEYVEFRLLVSVGIEEKIRL